MVDMVMHQILPAAMRYCSDLAEGINRKRLALGADINLAADVTLVSQLSAVCNTLHEKCNQLCSDLENIPSDNRAAADYYSDIIVPKMANLRTDADFLEKITAKSYWPYPSYSDLLFY